MSSAPRRALRTLGIAAALALTPLAAYAQGVVNVYTTREPALAKPLFDNFTAQTGIKVNTVFVQQGIAERVQAEGASSPADVLMVVDYGGLVDFVDRGLTQTVSSKVLEDAIPAGLRDAKGNWFALSMRARLIYVSKDRVKDEKLTYEDLADPRFKGKVCIRSGQHPYNTSLFAAYMAKHGPEATEKFIAGLKANLARKPAGGDRDGARDILAGICDIAVGNSYYVGLMKSGAGGEEQKKWAESIRVIFPTFSDGKGSHVNVSGAAVAKNAPNRDNAVKFLEFLVSAGMQGILGEANFEYPVKPGAHVNELTAGLGKLTIDPMPLTDIAKHRKAASVLVDKVGFDN